jgi:hypothetical protein
MNAAMASEIARLETMTITKVVERSNRSLARNAETETNAT